MTEEMRIGISIRLALAAAGLAGLLLTGVMKYPVYFPAGFAVVFLAGIILTFVYSFLQHHKSP